VLHGSAPIINTIDVVVNLNVTAFFRPPQKQHHQPC
jgi:hypothetical protein